MRGEDCKEIWGNFGAGGPSLYLDCGDGFMG